MFRLAKAELFKLSKNRTFKVLCVVAICLSIIVFVMTTSVFDKIIEKATMGMSQEEAQRMLDLGFSGSDKEQIVIPGSFGVHLNAKDPFNPTVPEVFSSSFGEGLIEVLIGILIAAFLAKEYSEGTIKNILAYGKNRSEFYLSKFIAIVVAIIVILFCLILIPTIGSFIINGWGEPFKTSQLVRMIVSFFLTVISNASVAALLMIIAISVKSNGGTIGITVGMFVLFPSIISFIYGLNKVFDKIYEITPYYNNKVAISLYASNGDLIKSLIVSLITIIISLFVGIQIFKKQDVK